MRYAKQFRFFYLFTLTFSSKGHGEENSKSTNHRSLNNSSLTTSPNATAQSETNFKDNNDSSTTQSFLTKIKVGYNNNLIQSLDLNKIQPDEIQNPIQWVILDDDLSPSQNQENTYAVPAKDFQETVTDMKNVWNLPFDETLIGQFLQQMSLDYTTSFATNPAITNVRIDYILPPKIDVVENNIRRQYSDADTSAQQQYDSGGYSDEDASVTETTSDYGRSLPDDYRSQIEKEAELLIKQQKVGRNKTSDPTWTPAHLRLSYDAKNKVGHRSAPPIKSDSVFFYKATRKDKKPTQYTEKPTYIRDDISHSHGSDQDPPQYSKGLNHSSNLQNIDHANENEYYDAELPEHEQMNDEESPDSIDCEDNDDNNEEDQPQTYNDVDSPQYQHPGQPFYDSPTTSSPSPSNYDENHENCEEGQSCEYADSPQYQRPGQPFDDVEPTISSHSPSSYEDEENYVNCDTHQNQETPSEQRHPENGQSYQPHSSGIYKEDGARNSFIPQYHSPQILQGVNIREKDERFHRVKNLNQQDYLHRERANKLTGIRLEGGFKPIYRNVGPIKKSNEEMSDVPMQEITSTQDQRSPSVQSIDKNILFKLLINNKAYLAMLRELQTPVHDMMIAVGASESSTIQSVMEIKVPTVRVHLSKLSRHKRHDYTNQRPTINNKMKARRSDVAEHIIYAIVPNSDSYHYGYRMGDRNHKLEGHDNRHGDHSSTQLKWSDKDGNFGNQYWEFNHGNEAELSTAASH